MNCPSPAARRPSQSGAQPSWRRWGKLVSETLLTVLSILGALSIVVAIAALSFHVHILIFKTGSMAPTIPTGSLALIRQLPVSEVGIGDVVTVDRGKDELPVTHRIINIAPSPTDPAKRLLRLQGDANTTEDIFPYDVATVGKVFYSHPEWGFWVTKYNSPRQLIILVILAGLLVTWAFWPREEQD